MLVPGEPENERRIRYMVRTEPGARKAVMAGIEDMLLKVDDGRILITGGTTAGNLISADLELFDPVAASSAIAGEMTLCPRPASVS